MRKIALFEPGFFLFFGLFHLHRIWGLFDRKAYASFWLQVMEQRGALYFLLMGVLAALCLVGMIVFFRNWPRNPWWRWIYLFGGGYVLFDLFAIATGLQFWQRLLLWMFDTASPYWNLLWSIFIALGAFSFGLGIWLLNKRIKQGRITA